MFHCIKSFKLTILAISQWRIQKYQWSSKIISCKERKMLYFFSITRGYSVFHKLFVIFTTMFHCIKSFTLTILAICQWRIRSLLLHCPVVDVAALQFVGSSTLVLSLISNNFWLNFIFLLFSPSTKNLYHLLPFHINIFCPLLLLYAHGCFEITF